MLMDRALSTVSEYIHHRTLREQQIVLVLTQHTSLATRKTQVRSFMSSWQLVRAIYTKPLPLTLKLAAQNNVLKHLAKLEVDGLVMNSQRSMGAGAVPGLLSLIDLDLWCVVE